MPSSRIQTTTVRSYPMPDWLVALPSEQVLADEIARAMERADKVLGQGRVKYIHPDCGFWILKRGIADGKIRALVRGRNLYEGRH